MKVWKHVRLLDNTMVLYSEPKDTSAIVEELKQNTELTICAFCPGWSEARLLNNERGFIKDGSKMFTKLSGVLQDNTITLYAQPDQATSRTRTILKGEGVIAEELFDKNGKEWLQIKCVNGEVGYIAGAVHLTNCKEVTVDEKTWSCDKCFEVNPDAQNTCCKCGAKMDQLFVRMMNRSLMYKIIGEDRKEYGPATYEQVCQWLAQRRVNGKTVVQAVGTGQWRALANCQEFSQYDFSVNTIPSPETRSMWAKGYICPRCGGSVSRGTASVGEINNLFGWVFYSIYMVFAQFHCTKCGRIPGSQFPPKVRIVMALRTLRWLVVAAVCLGAIGLAIFVCFVLPKLK